MMMNVVQPEQLPTSLETRYEELVTVTSLSQSLKVGIKIPLFKLTCRSAAEAEKQCDYCVTLMIQFSHGIPPNICIWRMTVWPT
jgi:hypothetical protein